MPALPNRCRHEGADRTARRNARPRWLVCDRTGARGVRAGGHRERPRTGIRRDAAVLWTILRRANAPLRRPARPGFGRAEGGERVGQYGEISGSAVSIKKKK